MPFTKYPLTTTKREVGIISMHKGLPQKDFKQVGRYISVRCILLIGHNWVTTYITVRCTFAKPQTPILGGSNTQGAAHRNLVAYFNK